MFGMISSVKFHAYIRIILPVQPKQLCFFFFFPETVQANKLPSMYGCPVRLAVHFYT